MKCIPVDMIYRYLDGELPGTKAEDVCRHAEACPRCKTALEERAALHQASNSLPLWTPPSDFISNTMDLLPVEKESLWNPVIAIAVGFASATLLVFSYLLMTGQNLASFFIGLSHTFLHLVRTLSVGFVKTWKLVSIFFKVVWQIGSFLISGFGRFSNIMSTEVQVALIMMACLIYIALFFGIRKKLFTGERA